MKKGIFIIERFNGVSEFITTIAKRPANSHFWSERDELSSDTKDKSFTMTKNYVESESLMASGYCEGLADLQKAGAFKVNRTTNVIRHVPHASVVGYAPHVPSAIAGIPQSMIGTTNIQQKSKIVTILYDNGAACYTDASKFIEAGRTLMSLIIKLEMQGYRVQLDILSSFCTPKEMALCMVTVKSHRHPLNPLKISYLLLHPSFFRRQGFRWLETQPETTFKYSGYGRVLAFGCPKGKTPDAIRSYLAENELLEAGVFYTNLYEALDHSPEELAEKMGITIKK